MYYLRARYYDANLGRFVSRDPIGMVDSVNLYTYTRNSPLNYTDRDGKMSKSVLIIKGVETNNKNYGFVKYATEIEKKYLNQSGISNDKIQELDIRTVDELSALLGKIDSGQPQYEQIIIIAHGSSDTITFGNGDNGVLTKKSLKSIQVSQEFSVPIQLDSCNTGLGTNSIGELLSRQLGTQIDAPNNYIVVDGSRENISIQGYFFDEANVPEKDFTQNFREAVLTDRWFEKGQYNTFYN